MTPPDGVDGLIAAGGDLYAAGLVTSHGGNLSQRLAPPDSERGGAPGALISAAGAMLGRLTIDDLVAVDSSGAATDSGPAPSSNTAIHLAIYAAHDPAAAIVHAHPVYATARTLADGADTIEPANFEGQLLLPRVPVLPEGSEETPQAIAAALDAGSAPIVMVRGHGSFAIGADVWAALMLSSALEEAAQILTLAGR
ncbi:MAG: class II aldolase/adducin family protein [Dehalococcoidia bacterium]